MSIVQLALGLIYAVCAYLLGCLLWTILNPLYRWQYRHLPGPRYTPIFGNLGSFQNGSSHLFQQHYKQLYGPVCKVWFGFRPVVWVADAELGKRVCYKLLNRPDWMGDPLTSGPARLGKNRGLFSSRDNVWRMLRRVWQPAFYADSVTACAPLMRGAALRLCSRLEALAAAGEPVVDICREIGNLTMATVGSSAYGIDFQTIHDPNQQQPKQQQPVEQQHKLIESAKTLFAALGAASGSRWQVAALLTPPLLGLRPVIRWLAHQLPDAHFQRVMESRNTLFQNSLQLVEQSREKLQQEQAAGRCSSPTGGRRTGPIAPGSFLGLLLGAADGLSDFQLCMQATTFTLAGFETTANTLAFALFLLATHPEAEAKCLQEIRAAAASGWAGLDAKQASSHDLEQQFPYVCAVVNEALRLFPPGASLAREVGCEPMQLGGHTLPPGTAVFVNTYAIQRDPDIWPRPDECVPERWLPGGEHLAPKTAAAMMPFGSGGRMCIGFRFALQEIHLSLIELLGRFRFQLCWELMQPPLPAPGEEDSAAAAAGDARRELRVVNRFTLSPDGGIWVKLVPRGTEADLPA